MFENIKKLFYKNVSLKGMLLANSRIIGGKWGSKQRMNAYADSAYVHACVKARAEKFGQLINFRFEDKKGNEILNDPYLKLLHHPNTYQTKSEFWELYQTFKDLTGSAFIYMLRTAGSNVPDELHLLSPDCVTIMVSKDTGLPEMYKYKTARGNEVLYDAKDIIASVYPNPIDFAINSYSGFSSLTPIEKRVETEKQFIDYQNNVLKNGGKVEGVIKFKTEVMNKEQLEEIKLQYDEQFAEAKHSGRPMVLYGDTEYEKIGLTQEEMSYIESLHLTRDDIMMIFRTPKTILGMTDGVQKGNYDEANAMFIRDVIKPLIVNTVSKVDEFMVLDDNKIVTFVDPTPDDVELDIKRVESGTNHQYMTINEKRELMGLEPLTDGGDQILVPFNLIPLDNIGIKTDPNKKGIKKKL